MSKQKLSAKRPVHERSLWPWIGLAVVLLIGLGGVIGSLVWVIIASRPDLADRRVAAGPAGSAASGAFGSGSASLASVATNPFPFAPLPTWPLSPPATNPSSPLATNPFPPLNSNPFNPPAGNPPAPNPDLPPRQQGPPALEGAVVVGPKESFLIAKQDGEVLSRQPQPGKVTSIAVSPDGRIVVAGGSVPPLHAGYGSGTRPGNSGVVAAWDATTWKPLPVFPKDYKPAVVEGSAGMHKVAFWGDSRHALCIMDSGDALLCELGAGQKPRSLKLKNAAVHRIFSIDGRRALVDGDDDSIQLWDMGAQFDRSQRLQEFIGHAQHPGSAMFLPDGKRILSTSGDGTVRLWDAKTGQQLRRYDPEGESYYPILHAALLSGGKQALIALRDTLILWDVDQWQEVRRWPGPIASIYPGMRLLPTAGERVPLNPSRAAAGIRHVEGVGSLFRPDLPGQQRADGPDEKDSRPLDRRLALLACFDSTIRLWDIDKGQELCAFGGYGGAIDCLAVLPDGRQFVTGDSEGYVRVWQLPADEALARFAAPADLQSVPVKDTWPANQPIQPIRRLYSGGGGFVHSAAFSKDGRRAITCMDHFESSKPGHPAHESMLRIWNVAEVGELRRSRTPIPPMAKVTCLAISPDGKQALGGCGGPALGGDTAIRVWDLETGRVARQLTGHSAGVGCVAYSADGKRAVSGCTGEGQPAAPERDFAIIFWNAGGGEVRRLIGHHGPVNGVALSPDGKQVVSASGRVRPGGEPLPNQPNQEIDNTVRLWDAAAGREIRRLDGHAGPVLCGVFSPDGRRILSGGSDKTMRLWDVQTGKELRRFDGHTGPVTRVVFSPDGRRALSGGGASDGTVRLWDLETGRQLAQYQANITGVLALQFSPDGREALAAAASDLLVWRLPP